MSGSHNESVCLRALVCVCKLHCTTTILFSPQTNQQHLHNIQSIQMALFAGMQKKENDNPISLQHVNFNQF